MSLFARLSLALALVLTLAAAPFAAAQPEDPTATPDETPAAVSQSVDPAAADTPPAPDQPDAPAATFVVNSTNDPGSGNCDAAECTLREAIIAANANGATQDSIQFNIPGGGPHVITLAAALQPINHPLIIDGLTQPGASCTSLPADPRIVVNGSGLPGGTPGLVVNAGNTRLRGLVIQRFSSHGVVLQGGSGIVLECNYIGTNAAGANDLGNGGIGVFVNNTPGATLLRNLISGNGSYGVYLGGGSASGNVLRSNFIGTNENGTAGIPNDQTGVLVESAANTTIGGVQAADRNLISGNGGFGVAVNGTSGGTVVRGNYIGVSSNGNAALGNSAGGVSVASANGIQIGGSDAGAGNVISGNGSAGLTLQSNAQNTVVARNIIGLNAAATAKVANSSYGIYLPNGNNSVIGGNGIGNTIAGNGQDGIFISGSSTNNAIYGNFIGTNQSGGGNLGNDMFGVHISLAPGNIIGDAGSGRGNVIANNGADGIYISGQSAVRNAIRANNIRGNGGLGIDLGDNGVTPNDSGDPDVGPNDLQNFPVVTAVGSSGSQTQFSGTLNSLPNRNFRIDFYSSPSCDPSGHGEGANYVGWRDVTTNGAGNTSFSFTLPIGISVGWAVTATASDPSLGGQTSEFSQCRQVVAQSFTREFYLPLIGRQFSSQ